MPLAPASTLPNLLAEWQKRLQAWALDGSLTAAAQEALGLGGEPKALGLGGEPKALADLVAAWARGNFSDLPPVVLLSSAEIKGALGAYAVSTGSIYLNADWLLSASQEQVNAVLTEELGHHLDGLLNAVDTVGDEGEFFASILTDAQATNINTVKSNEYDRIIISADGQELYAEAAAQCAQRSSRILIGSSWGTSSYINIVVNGISGFRQFYLNGKQDWSASEVAAGIRDLINGMNAGVSASIALDDPNTIIAWTNVVNGPLSISYTKGTSNYPAGAISQIIDNNIDDSSALLPPLVATIASPDSKTFKVQARPLSGDNENIFSIKKITWFKVGQDGSRTLLQEGLAESIQVDALTGGSFVQSIQYIDGELNNRTIETQALSLAPLNSDTMISSSRILIGSSWGTSSYINIVVNGISGFRQFYLNGKQDWSASEVAAGIRDLINGMNAGVSASIALDDPNTIIAWTNVVNGPLSISYTKGTSNYPAGAISQIIDNNIDNGSANLQITRSVSTPCSNTEILNPNLSSEIENVFKINSSTWSISGKEIRATSALQSINVARNLDATYTLSIQYYDGELNLGDIYAQISIGDGINDGSAIFGISGLLSEGLSVASQIVSDDPNGNGSGGFSYYWQTSSNGTTWSNVGTNSASYTVSAADEGKQIQLVVSYTDAQDFNESVTTSARTIPFVNDAPIELRLTSNGIAENNSAGTVIGSLSATDPDADSSFTYALVTGSGGNDTDNALVEIIGDQVRVKSGAVIDFEAKPILDLYIQVTDNGGLTFAKALTVDVANLQEGGSIAAITSSIYNALPFVEGVTLTAGTVTDPDNVAGPITYKWFKGNTEVQSGSSDTYTVGAQGQGTFRVEATYKDGTYETVTAVSANQVVDKVNNGSATFKISHGIAISSIDYAFFMWWYSNRSDWNANWSAPAIVIGKSLTASEELTFRGSGSIDVDPGWAGTGDRVNAAGIILAGYQDRNGNGPGQYNSWLLTNPDGTVASPIDPTAAYGAVLIGNPDIGWKELFAPTAENGLSAINPPTDLTAKASLQSLFGNALQDGTKLFLAYSDQDNGNISSLRIEVAKTDAKTACEGEVLSAQFLSTDPDGNGTVTSYQWYHNSSAIAGATASTYTTTTTGFGTYAVAVTYMDSQGYSDTVQSSELAVAKIDNGQGTLSAITGNTAFNEGVILSAGAITGDPDGPATNITYQWYLNGAAIAGATAATFTTSATGFGNYKVAMTYVDGQGYSGTVQSSEQAVANVNEAPTDLILTTIGINENSPAGTLIGTLAATDPDAGSTFTYVLFAGNGTNDADNPLVEIVGNEVLVKSGASIDYETNSTLNLNIQVIDNGTPGLTFTKAVIAAVINITSDDLPVISLAVSPTVVSEDGTANLVYTFTRSGPTTTALSVNYTASGTATIGTDYTGIAPTPSTKTVTFAANSSTATVTVDPVADLDVESDETVILTLAAGSAYSVGNPAAVTGTIVNNDFRGTGNSNLSGTLYDDNYFGVGANNTFNGFAGYDRAFRNDGPSNYLISGTVGTNGSAKTEDNTSGVVLLDTLINIESIQITSGNSNSRINAGGGRIDRTGLTRSAYEGTLIAQGGLGFDVITGGSNRNWLAGGGLAAGAKGIDYLTGTSNTSAGAIDYFDLRNATNTAPAYVGQGNLDYARIDKFNATTDKLVLTGQLSDYRFKYVEVKLNNTTTVTDSYWSVARSSDNDLIAQLRGDFNGFQAAGSTVFGGGDHASFGFA